MSRSSKNLDSFKHIGTPFCAKKLSRLVKLGGSGAEGYPCEKLQGDTKRTSSASQSHVLTLTGALVWPLAGGLLVIYAIDLSECRLWKREAREPLLTSAPAALPAPHSCAVELGGVKRRTTS